MSREPVTNDQQLIRYLLGLLPDDEAERLDELSIVDDDVAARLRTVENDIVDAYVRGSLDPALLKPFETHYLASPRRREKVTFARRFLDTVDRAPEVETVGATADEPVRRLAERAPRRSQRLWLPLAAAVLLLACGVLLFQDARLRRGLTEAQQASAMVDRRAQALAGELEQQRAANDALTKQLDRDRAPRPPLSTVALVLMPQTRAVGPVSTIAVAPGTEAVPFDLRLESNDFTRYEVALRDPANDRVIWRSQAVAARRPSTISISVPATLLKPQHYSLELSGRTSAGTLEIIGSYAFEIDAR